MTAAPRDPGLRPAALGAVAAGGVLGAEARLGVSQLFSQSAQSFPWSTLVINTSGCLLVGAVVAALVARAANPIARLFLTVGVLGGYTTFSAYTVDAVQLVEKGRVIAAAAYVVGTLSLAVAAVALGGALVRGVSRDPGQQT